MNEEPFFKKLEFTKANNIFTPNEEFIREIYFFKIDTLRIRLVEITGIENPTDIVIKINEDGHKTFVPLYLLRTKFICQNNRYMLDVDGYSPHIINPMKSFSIEVACAQNFNLVMYCEGIPKQLKPPMTSG